MIRNIYGVTSTDSLVINSTFKEFYKSLYSSESKATDSDITTFLRNIRLRLCSEEDRSILNAPFSVEEVWVAIQSMPNGKWPWFPIGVFQKFLA